MGEENTHEDKKPAPPTVSTVTIYAAVFAVFVGSLSNIYSSLIRNPVDEIDILDAQFRAHINEFDQRVDTLDGKVNILTFRIGECNERTKWNKD